MKLTENCRGVRVMLKGTQRKKERRERCLEKMKTVMNNLCFKRTSLYVTKQFLQQ